jgi:SOS-response transcriptional repressor LexA
VYKGNENMITAQKLKDGETCIIQGFGQSMTPILKSGQPVMVAPVTEETPLDKGDIVFCKVNGHFYLHKILAVKNETTYQIGNNHGHVNGWASRNCIYGKVSEVLP